MDDASRILRLRQTGRADDAYRIFADNPDPRPWFGRVIDGGSIPTGPDKYYLVAPSSMNSPECEGCTLGEVLDSTLAVLVAIVRGSPVAGDPITVRSAGGRWVGERKAVVAPPCAGILTVTVNCIFGSALLIAGATVTITKGATTLTATTNGSGQAIFAPGSSGVWTIMATKGGYSTYAGTVTFACANISTTATIAVVTGIVSGRISGCFGVSMPGVALEVRNSTGSTVIATGTTTGATSGNNYSISFPTGGAISFRLYTSRSKFATGFFSFLINCAGATTVTGGLGVDSDHSCANCTSSSYEPVYKTLYSTSWLGSVTLTLTPPGGSSWQGSATINRAVYVGGAIGTTSAADVTIFIVYGTTNVTFQAYTLNASTTTIVSDAYAAANPSLVAIRGVSVTGIPCGGAGGPGSSCSHPPLFFTGFGAIDPFSGACSDVTVTE